MNPASIKELLLAAEQATGGPVMTVATCWSGEHAVDLDDAAARCFLDVLQARIASTHDSSSPVTLVLMGRGGYPSFSDAVFRLLKGMGLPYKVCIPCPIDGAFGLLCLGASELILHPFGALGAIDAGPLVPNPAGLRIQPLEPTALHEHLRVVAQNLARRILTTSHPQIDRAAISSVLSLDSLGASLGLAAHELSELGFNATIAAPEIAAPLWDLFLHYEDQLSLGHRPRKRYSPSKWAGEVEFEPAFNITAATIESTAAQMTFELDTGSPDPDLKRLQGYWTHA